MLKYIVVAIISFIFDGCIYMVGGECNYQSTQGIALIKSKIKNSCLAEFTPKQVNYGIKFTCKDEVKVGQSYSAILKKTRHASCTPVVLNLINEIQ